MTKRRSPDIRLVAIDLDGTLLQDDKTIASEDLAAVRETAARGVHVVLASGRSARSMRPHWERVGLPNPIVACNGAQVHDLVTGEDLWLQPIPPEVVRKVLVEVQQLIPEAYIGMEMTDHRLAVNRIYEQLQWKLTPPRQLFVGDLEAWASEIVLKLWVYVPGMSVRELQRLLKSRWDSRLRIEYQTSASIQVLDSRAGKGVAVRWLAAQHGISPDQIMAIGDHTNDLEMLQAVGWPVAMGNAEEEVKAVARWVTSSNAEIGVAQALHRWVLE
ncbi:MAG TPA: HAD family phosphatase [Anaerolineae bacterium]|nr:HAD family phosphatase [Anaerolineae bacterium]